LSFYYLGYERKELKFDKIELPLYRDILMIPEYYESMGEIRVIEKKPWWKFWK
jgi:hypothetical protein